MLSVSLDRQIHVKYSNPNGGVEPYLFFSVIFLESRLFTSLTYEYVYGLNPYDRWGVVSVLAY